MDSSGLRLSFLTHCGLGGLIALALASPAFSETSPVPSPSAAASASPAPTASGANPSGPTDSPAPTEQILVPRGTIVVVKTIHGINSYGTESGDKLTYEVLQDVIVNGY